MQESILKCIGQFNLNSCVNSIKLSKIRMFLRAQKAPESMRMRILEESTEENLSTIRIKLR